MIDFLGYHIQKLKRKKTASSDTDVERRRLNRRTSTKHLINLTSLSSGPPLRGG